MPGQGQGGRLGRIPLSVQYAVRKPPEAGMVPPSGAFRLFGPLPWGKETLLMHDDTSKTQILTSPVTGRAAGLGETPDTYFASGLMGSGAVLFPQEGRPFHRGHPLSQDRCHPGNHTAGRCSHRRPLSQSLRQALHHHSPARRSDPGRWQRETCHTWPGNRPDESDGRQSPNPGRRR